VAELKLPGRPTDLASLQAVAAVGQRCLMDAWARAFEPHGLPVAQILLTREDADSRTRFLNLRNTLNAVQKLGAIPIINENDTVSTDELVRITFGDNDLLAAMVSTAMRADLLVLMTVVDGVLDAGGKPLRTVSKITDAAGHVRTGEKSKLGKGGMNSKLAAAGLMTGVGAALIVANGRTENLLPRLLAGEVLGTLFVPRSTRKTGKSLWIGAARPAGVVTVDAGAAIAVAEKNRSLLPAGVTKVEGKFKVGDVIGIANSAGELIARGLSNYDAPTADLIRGMKSAEIRKLLGSAAYDEIVHRDNLVLC
jgi:glutamate 5-kinase